MRFVLALFLWGCSSNGLIDIAMGGAVHPASSRGMRVGDRVVVAGDLHTHVLPPDHPRHVSRNLEETIALAEAEGIEWVVLTPHVPSRFFMDPHERQWVTETQAELRAHLARLHPSMIVVTGFEYTDYSYGHAGFGFADLDAVLGEAPIDAPPERFFERWIARGGLITINHPVLRETPGTVFSPLKWDMSWRGFWKPDVPPEIEWLTHHAQSIETFNLGLSWLRDHLLLRDDDRALREATHLVEVASHTDNRRIAPVGGTDSHGQWLRPTTWVLARERTKEAIRDAIVEARTCVRGPEACTLEIRAPGGAWHGIGDSLEHVDAIEARAAGDLTLLANGAIVGRARPGEIVRASLPNRCAFVRAIVNDSWSAPIYVGCTI
jgi:hypothetical protein